jgi:hypothetical protein
MATSGSVDFSVNRDEIIKGALRALKVIGRGKIATAGELADGAEALNMLVKQWQGIQDYAPGLKVWTRKRGVIFLENGKASYVLDTDEATTSYVETTVDGNEASGQTVISVADATGISNGDYICIVMDDDNLHTTTVNGAPSGNDVTITDALTAAAADGNKVYAYTTKMMQPIKILQAYLRDENGDDFPVDVDMTLEQYEALPDKDVAGTPSRLYFEKSRTSATVFLDAAPDNVDYVLHVTFLRPIEDFDSSTDEPDYPQHWFRALKFNLALDIADEFGKTPTQNLISRANESLLIAQTADFEGVDVIYEPEADDGY